jgi:hypothetical protein
VSGVGNWYDVAGGEFLYLSFPRHCCRRMREDDSPNEKGRLAQLVSVPLLRQCHSWKVDMAVCKACMVACRAI